MKKKYLIALFILFAAGTAALSLAAVSAQERSDEPARANVVPEGFGINIHTHASFPYTLKPVKEAGFNLVRTNIYWHQIEKEKGKYDWRDYDKLLLEMTKQGIRPLLVISFSNTLYAPVQEVIGLDGKTISKAFAPATEESIRAYANFAAEAARRYKDHDVIWEIWNEPDYKVFWVPEPNAADYDRLASHTCAAIKKADPAATVIGPAASSTPTDKAEWWEAFLKGSAVDCLDAISVHPYVYNTNKGPEINIEKYDHIRSLLAKRTERVLPLISSEFGYSTADWAVTRERQAALMVRNYMVNLLSGVVVSVWYSWVDDGMDAKQREHNFGVMTRKLVRKPTYHAAQNLAKRLEGYQLEARVDTDGKPLDKSSAGSDLFLLLFRHPQKPPVIVAWRADKEPKAYSVSTRAFGEHSPKVADYLGEDLPVTIQNGKLSLNLNEFPVYISAEGR